MENLFWTGKTKRFTGAAVGDNREETTQPPARSQTTPTGAPTQPLQRCWDAPGGVGSWEGVKGKGKLSWRINTHFPYTTNKLQEHPAGYFQVSTTFLTHPSAKNQVFPRKTPSQKEPIAHGRRQHPEHGAGKGSPRCQGCSSWTKCATGPGIPISCLEGSKQQFLPRQHWHPRLHAEPSYIKAAFW